MKFFKSICILLWYILMLSLGSILLYFPGSIGVVPDFIFISTFICIFLTPIRLEFFLFFGAFYLDMLMNKPMGYFAFFYVLNILMLRGIKYLMLDNIRFLFLLLLVPVVTSIKYLISNFIGLAFNIPTNALGKVFSLIGYESLYNMLAFIPLYCCLKPLFKWVSASKKNDYS